MTDTLRKLANRLEDPGEAAREFVQLINQAQAIASSARSIQTSRWGIVENSETLAADLATFADRVAASSIRFAHEVETNSTLVSALAAQVQRVKLVGATLLHTDDTNRAKPNLLSFECALAALKEKMACATRAAHDIGALAASTRSLAAYAPRLRGSGREVEQAAATIIQALNAFTEEAQRIATRLSAAADDGVPGCGVVPNSTEAVANRQSIPSGAAQVSGMGWR